MKIAISTFHTALNYGAVMQAFALKTFLCNASHDVLFVNHQFGSLPRGIRKYVGSTAGNTAAKLIALRRHGAFAPFYAQHFGQRHNQDDADGFIKTPPEAHAYISGSDQVWNPNYLGTERDEKLFFLDFGPESVRRIAYAASLGVESLTPRWANRFAQHLQRFDHIGVRETHACDLLAGLTRKPVELVPDPTLLLEPNDYAPLLNIRQDSRAAIFFYILGNKRSTLATQVQSTLKQRLEIPVYDSYERNIVRAYFHGVPTPSQWLSRLANSAFVLTNSYHATVFALLLHRPFIVVARDGGDSRITSLLNRLDLQSRYVKYYSESDLKNLCATTINWHDVDAKRLLFADVGKTFLLKAMTC